MTIFSHIDRRFIFLLLSNYARTSISAICYTPNGTDTKLIGGQDWYQPCNAHAEFSMCCALNRGNKSDRCRGDGLCVNDVGGHLWRESCTDPTWQSSSCLKLCLTETNDTGDTDTLLTICPDESLCCGTENNACCKNHQGFWIKNGQVSNVNPFAHSSITASFTSMSSFISSSTTSSPSSSSSSALSDSTSSSNNTGAIIGGVVGGVFGVALSAGLVWSILRRRKLSRLQQSTSSHDLVSSIEKESAQPHEISGTQQYHEADGQELVEMAAHG